MEPFLVTGRLVLRPFTAADAGGLAALDGDPEVMRFLDSRLKSRAEIEATVLPQFLRYHERYRDFGYWAADTRDGGGFIGWFSLRPVEPAAGAMVHWDDAGGDVRVAGLGYRLRRSAWSRGYATEGARALVRRTFAGTAVAEIVATTMAVNTASRAVLEKAGLRYDRTVHVDWPDPLPGTEHGEAYRLRRDEWLAEPGRKCGQAD